MEWTTPISHAGRTAGIIWILQSVLTRSQGRQNRTPRLTHQPVAVLLEQFDLPRRVYLRLLGARGATHLPEV